MKETLHFYGVLVVRFMNNALETGDLRHFITAVAADTPTAIRISAFLFRDVAVSAPRGEAGRRRWRRVPCLDGAECGVRRFTARVFAAGVFG
jgi:hypothetical protein